MIRLGVIGYGRRMQSVVAAIGRVDARARIAALVDPNADALRAACPDELAGAVVYHDADSMLGGADLDGVLIGTRCSLHTPYACEVLASGLPLFLEKPVATSWEQAAQLREAAARTRSPVVVSFPLRVSAMCELAKEILDAGVLGEVGQVQAVNNVPAYAAGYYHGWMRDESETGGLWIQKATHDFDYLSYLVGQPAIRIAATESKTVFTGDMPAGLRCVDCWRDDCPEKERATETWLCAFAPDTGNHDSASALIQYASAANPVASLSQPSTKRSAMPQRPTAPRAAVVLPFIVSIQLPTGPGWSPRTHWRRSSSSASWRRWWSPNRSRT